MSVVIVTFANLGSKTNLKTPDVLPVIQTFSQAGDLAQVICQLRKGFFFRNTVSAFPAVVRYGLGALRRISGTLVSRRQHEALFDYFAQFKLEPADIYLFHAGGFLSETFKRAKRYGGLVIDITVGAHIRTNRDLEHEEFMSLGLAAWAGANAELYEISTHVNQFDYVIAISEFVRDSYVTAGYPKDRIFVAHPDVDTARFYPVHRARDRIFRIVYAAYTTPLKGLHYLLDAWESLALADAELILVGGNPGGLPRELTARYEARIASLPSVRTVGNTLTPENWYRQGDALVFPSLTEGFGRVTLEAMACGIPVITTENARGIVEDGKTGFIVPIRDSAAIAQKIRYLYDHREVAEAMGKRARAAVETKKPFGQAVYEIYQDILKREGKV